MAEGNFNSTASALFNGMNNVLSTKTVVGEATHIGDTIILPLVDVSFGMGAGANGGALGGKMSPSAVLVIQDGTSKIISVKNNDSISKIIDMIPDVINKIFKKKENGDELTDEEILEAAKLDK